LSHARSLADLYHFDVSVAGGVSFHLTAADGRAVFDPTNPFDPRDAIPAMPSNHKTLFLYRNQEQDLMSCPCTPFYSLYSSLLLNRLRGRRARCGNFNPPCNLGDWFTQMPPLAELRIRDGRGQPVSPRSQLTLYYDVGTGESHAFDHSQSDSLPVVRGQVTLPSDPFRIGGSMTRGGHNVLLLEVTAPRTDSFCFVEPSAFNIAYWMGYRDRQHPAVFDLRLGAKIQNGCNLRLPPALINEPFATSPYASRVWIGIDKHGAKHSDTSLTLQLLDDSTPAHSMRDRLVRVVDRLGRTRAVGLTDDAGTVTFERVPTPVTGLRLVDVTDNNLAIPIVGRS
jgi:hypothetical protein